MDLKHGIPNEEISVAAYYIWEKQYTYEVLCWLLAERQLYVNSEFIKPQIPKVNHLAEQIYTSKTPYDVICWYVGLYNLFIKKRTSKNNWSKIFKE